ncbi:MAG: hypothetical protein KIS92_03065 [Planctomycetota bacterium]|nr:hypothetical protein [Planctomycetota bacterium]
MQRRVDAVRGKERTTILLTGLSRTFLVLIGAVLAYFLLDWLFELPYLVRLAALLGLIGGVGYTFYKHVMLELRKIHDDDEIVLRVEARNPGLNGRLISSMQLSRASRKGEYVGSPELIAALETDTLRMAAPLDFLRVINREALVRFGVAAAVILVIKVVCLIRFPDYFEAAAMRIVDPSAQYPTKTRVADVKVHGKDGKEVKFVARGDEVRVRVTVDGVIPDSPGTLLFTSDKDGTQIPIDLNPEGGAVFAGTLSKALEDMSVVASVGDGRSHPVHIQVLARPEVSDGEIAYTLPSYAHIQAPPPDKFGGLSALMGSSANIQITSTKPLAKAKIVRLDSRELAFVQVDDKGLVWKLKDPFPIDKSNSFHVELLDHDGLTNSMPPVEYPVEAKPDQMPVVRIKRPGKDATVTPVAKPIVVFDARDDYGVRALWLVFRVLREGQSETAGETKRFELPKPPADSDRRNLLDAKFAWDLEALGVKPGDQITFWLEADDDCDNKNRQPVKIRRPHGEETPDAPQPESNEPQYARSGDLKFTVITKEEKAMELQAEIARLFEALKGMKDQQEDLKKKVRLIIEELQKELQNNK